jgi:phage internal scaffolding protein
MPIDWRHQYDAKRDKLESDRAGIGGFEPSLTVQSPAEDCDLNVLVKRFGIDVPLPPPAVFDPAYYGDVTDTPDLRTALDNIRLAQERFLALPARLRERFANSPAQLWDFVNDPENADEAVRLGLLTRPEPQGAPISPLPTSTPVPTETGAPSAS